MDIVVLYKDRVAFYKKNICIQGTYRLDFKSMEFALLPIAVRIQANLKLKFMWFAFQT